MNKIQVVSLLFVTVVATTAEKATTEAKERDGCPIPYLSMGGRCLFFDAMVDGTWQEARDFCQELQGHLVKVDIDNFMADIVAHIHQSGLTNAGFWVGANDLEEEGVWKWHDGTSVRMGTPFWGYVAEEPKQQEPGGGVIENCASMPLYKLYFFHDYSCDVTFSPLCELNDN